MTTLGPPPRLGYFCPGACAFMALTSTFYTANPPMSASHATPSTSSNDHMNGQHSHRNCNARLTRNADVYNKHTFERLAGQARHALHIQHPLRDVPRGVEPQPLPVLAHVHLPLPQEGQAQHAACGEKRTIFALDGVPPCGICKGGSTHLRHVACTYQVPGGLSGRPIAARGTAPA